MPALRALVPFARRGQLRRQHAQCELCSAPVAERHAHVLEREPRALRCACSACAVLFRDGGAANGRYRTVPDRVRALAATATGDADWLRLGVPVRLAFVVRREAWVAFYPSPAGPVEAPLSDEAAVALSTLVPDARAVEPDIEAILFDHPRGGAVRCFLVPIDACYELVALVRRTWRGFDGGDEARAAIDEFLARIAGAANKGAK